LIYFRKNKLNLAKINAIQSYLTLNKI